MSASDWHKFSKIAVTASAVFLLVALLYVGGFYVGLTSGYYKGQAERAAEQYPSDTQRIVEGCFKLPVGADRSKCVEAAVTASHENQRAEHDLKTQRDMSDWAWWAMVIGILQFIATIATLGFVKLTLDATLIAVKDTSEATQAMREANKIAREIGEAQTRAYLTITKAEFQIRDDSNPALHFEIKNFGSSPARGCRFSVRCGVVSGPNIVHLDDAHSPIGQPGDGFGQDIAPDETEHFNYLMSFDAVSVVNGIPGNALWSIDILMILRFEDVFGHVIDEPFQWTAFGDTLYYAHPLAKVPHTGMSLILQAAEQYA